MENSHRFFRNGDCQYFPCHKTSRPEKFNCLFCFCPLYFFEDCGGNYTRTAQGIKDCTNCLIPHTPKGYDYILKKLRERFEKERANGAHPEAPPEAGPVKDADEEDDSAPKT